MSITMSVLTQRLSVGALGSSAAWKSHTFIALDGDIETVCVLKSRIVTTSKVSISIGYCKSQLTRHMLH